MQAEILTIFRFAQAVDKLFYVSVDFIGACKQLQWSFQQGTWPLTPAPGWVLATTAMGSILNPSPSHTPLKCCHQVGNNF